MDKESIIKWLRDGNEFRAASLLEKCELDYHYVDTAFPLDGSHDIDIVEASIACSRKVYSQLTESLSEFVKQIEGAINECSQASWSHVRSINWIANPSISQNTDNNLSRLDKKNAEVIVAHLINMQRLMIAYVTGEREDTFPEQYRNLYIENDLLLEDLKLINPNPHQSLESFWEYCKSAKLGTYASRRAYVSDIYSELNIFANKAIRRTVSPRNWAKVDGQIKDELTSVRKQWAKAHHYIYSNTPDYENAIKEAINSVESTIKIYTDDYNGTLGNLIKSLALDKDVERLISQAYGYTSNRESVRHGGVVDSGLTKAEAEFFLEFSAISINYIKQKKKP